MRNFITAGLILILVVAACVILMKYPPFEKRQPVIIKGNMSLRHVAERNDVPLSSLFPLLPRPESGGFFTNFIHIHKPLQELEVDPQKLRAAILKARDEGFPAKDAVRFVLWSIVITSAGLLLIRKKGIPRIRRVWMLLVIGIFGVFFGAAPNPMEATVRLHKMIKGISGNPVVLVTLTFVVFVLMSLLGSRLFCSWGCPLGALQESLFNLPIFRKFKKKHKFPFSASIAIRITMYLFFFLLLFGWLNINQGGPGSILYHHFNLFKVFTPSELAWFTVFLIPFFLAFSLLVFRPFCHSICPFGLWSWLIGKAALYQVRKIDPDSCTGCGICEKECPTEAMKELNEGKKGFFKADCWSCGSCISVCPNDVLEFSRTTPSPKRPG
jgi:NAD-dependent dihydropyrimidine dehydrogenase PreA subunit